MNTLLAQPKYQLAARLSAEAGKTFGLWTLAAYAILQAVQGVLRVFTEFDGDFGFYLFGLLPVLLTAIAWVHLPKTYPRALGSGMTRKEFMQAYALFCAVLTAGGFAFGQLIVIVGELTDPSATEGFYGAEPLDGLTRAAVHVAAGALAGAILVRFQRDLTRGTLTGLLVTVLLLRQIPLQIATHNAPTGDGDLVLFQYPADGVPLAELDAALTVVLALLTWAVLSRAPMPGKRA